MHPHSTLLWKCGFILVLFLNGACRPKAAPSTRTSCTQPEAPPGDGPEVTLTGVAPGREEAEARVACVQQWKGEFRRHLEREKGRWAPELAVQTAFDDAWLDLLLHSASVETVPGCGRGTIRVRCGAPEALDTFRTIWGQFFPPASRESWRVAVLASEDQAGRRTRYHELLEEWFRFEVARESSGRFTVTRYLDDAEVLRDLTRPRLRAYRKSDVIVRLTLRQEPGQKPVLAVVFGHIPGRVGVQAALVSLTWWLDPPATPEGRGLPVMLDARPLQSAASEQAAPETWWRLAALFWKDQRDLQRKTGVDLAAARDWVRRACEAGSGEACLFHGVMVFEGQGLTAGNEQEAMELWRSACERGMAGPCLQFGVHQRAACGADLQCASARPFIEKGCTLGDAEACHWLATFHREVGSKDWRELMTRACRGGFPESCFVLGSDGALLDRQVRGELSAGDREDQARVLRVREYATRWCDRGNPFACLDVYRSHPPMDKLPKDARIPSLLAEFEPLRRSCVWGLANTCPELFNAADVLENLKAKTIGASERAAWGRTGCTDGNPATCGLAAVLYERLGRYASAGALAVQGCSEQDAGACWMWGRLILEDRIHPLSTDRPVDMFERGCKGEADGRVGDWPRQMACSWWARELVLAGDWEAVAGLREDLESHCAGGTGLACRILAEGARAGRWPPPRELSQLDLLENACRHGDAQGCHLLGGELERTGAQETATLKRAAAAYAAGCDENLLVSCEALIRLRDQAAAVVTDEQAMSALTAACWQHDRAAHCRKLSDWFDRGQLSEEANRAFLVWQAGRCVLGVPWACRVLLARVEDPEKIAKVIGQDCFDRWDLRTCAMVGVFHMEMAKKPVDRVSRFRDSSVLFEAACQENQPEACFLLATEREKLDSVEDQRGVIMEWLQKSCDLKLPAGCAELGYHLHAGRLVTRDLAAAERHLAWACDHRHGLACSNLGMLLVERGAATGAKADLTRAVGLWKAACEDLGSGVSCLNLGKVLRSGLPGLPADEKAGLGYIEKACELAFQPACEILKPREIK